VPSPKASLALIERACEMLGTPSPTAQLQVDAQEYDNRVTTFVADDGDLMGYVARLESLADSGQLVDDDYFSDGSENDGDEDDDDDDTVGGELADDATEVVASEVNSEELMKEVERFLRDQGST
jgi:hypothetical protein